MNKDNINATIDVMRTTKEYLFDMGFFVGHKYDDNDNQCGTTCCLAGFAHIALEGNSGEHSIEHVDYFNIAKNYFDIDVATANALFIPRNDGINNRNIDDGIRALEQLRDHGTVLWESEEFRSEDY